MNTSYFIAFQTICCREIRKFVPEFFILIHCCFDLKKSIKIDCENQIMLLNWRTFHLHNSSEFVEEEVNRRICNDIICHDAFFDSNVIHLPVYKPSTEIFTEWTWDNESEEYEFTKRLWVAENRNLSRRVFWFQCNSFDVGTTRITAIPDTSTWFTIMKNADTLSFYLKI